jgi:hypothetical protein
VIRVELPPAYVRLAWRVAEGRMIGSLDRGAQQRHGAANASPAERLASEYLGAVAECGFGWRFGLHWPATVTRPPKDYPDVLPDWQIRAASTPGRRMIVHDDDPDEHRFALVVPENAGPCWPPVLCVVGWLWGWDCKRAEWWDDPTGRAPAYFVPQDALNRFDDAQ